MDVSLMRERLTGIRRYLVHIHQYLSMKASVIPQSIAPVHLPVHVWVIGSTWYPVPQFLSRIHLGSSLSINLYVCWCLPIRARHVFTSMSVGTIVFIHSTFVHIYTRDRNLSAVTSRSYLDILHVWSTRHSRHRILRCIETSREYFHISSCLHMDSTDIRWCLKHRRTRLSREENEHWQRQTVTTSVIAHFKSRFTNN